MFYLQFGFITKEEKFIEDCENERNKYGLSSKQGWRNCET